MKYVYFVSYRWYASNSSGNGRCDITQENPVESMDDIVGMEALIKGSVEKMVAPEAVENIIILNYQLMRREL